MADFKYLEKLSPEELKRLLAVYSRDKSAIGQMLVAAVERVLRRLY